ncbi:MAG: hypothetical protein LBF55_03275 [Prevotellaceae bacterium]|jgi:hypothetical protein|nr:hypothetical protein [Prevotellaceae bacterium]
MTRLLLVLALLFGAGCRPNQGGSKIPYDPALPLEGAAQYDGTFDVKNSPYYKTVDFYNLKSGGSFVLLEHFKTIQQATGVTCGPVCALMVLEYYGRRQGLNEKQIQALRGTGQDTTYLRHIIQIFDSIGGFEHQSTFGYREANPETIADTFFLPYLRRGIPVIVGSNIWGGHWQIIIGYDTMGTPATADDVLILAEPYDTTDHHQDGYTVISLQHFYEGAWRNYFDPDYPWGLFIAASPQ